MKEGAGQISRPTVAIRVDSGYEIGTGHVRRCLSMAFFLKKNNFRPIFICRNIAGGISHILEQAGFHVIYLPKNESLAFSVFSSDFSKADYDKMAFDAEESAYFFTQQYPREQAAWVVTDHMLIREPWQTLFANRMNCKVLVIDGQANAAHYADVLLDPQIHENPVDKWAGLLPDSCLVFSGPSCLPLSPAFESAQSNAVTRKGTVSRLLVCFGGTDTEDIVYRSVRALLSWVNEAENSTIEIDVAIPANLPSRKRLEKLLVDEPQCCLHIGLNDLSSLMSAASLSIGGGGTMLWERCLLGLPAIVVPLAQNQEDPIDRLVRQGAVFSIKSKGVKYESKLIQALEELSQDPTTLHNMSTNAFKVMSDWPKTDGWVKVMKGSINE